MIDRREFLQISGAAALATLAPAVSMAKLRQLPTRLIPGTDEQLSVIGLGNSQAFRSGDVELSTRLIDTFLNHGGAYIDVSGTSRLTVGRIIRERNAQDRSFLGNYLSGQDADELRSEIRTLQEAQGAGPLDLVVKRDIADLASRADQFRQLKDDGLARYVGIGRANERFYPGMMKLMDDGVIDFVQVNYSMIEPEAADDLLPMAMDKGVAVVINRPFINGDYFGIVKGHALPEWAAEFDCKSWAQFSLKFILSHPAVNCVLTETANPKHVLDNLGAGFGRLPDEKTRKTMQKLIQSFV